MASAPLKQANISLVRDILTAERIQEWLSERKLTPLVISGTECDGRVAITADSLLKALQSVPECRNLPLVKCSQSFTKRIRAYFVDQSIQAVRNYKPPGMSNPAPQLLVLPRETKIDGASISWALRVGDQYHEPSDVVGYKSRAKRMKREVSRVEGSWVKQVPLM
jgi:hypothetical protein